MMRLINKMRMSLFALFAVAVGAFAAEADAYTGNYQWKETPEAKAALEKAVDAGAQQVTWALRKIARGRLTDTTKPYASIKLAIKDGGISFERNGANPIVAKTDGKAIDWKREDGKAYKVAFSVEADGVLKQTFTADDGVRENRFSLSPDGKTLTMKASVSSKKLKVPVTFTLDYLRQDGEAKAATEKKP
jgi:hypothetical protein